MNAKLSIACLLATGCVTEDVATTTQLVAGGDLEGEVTALPLSTSASIEVPVALCDDAQDPSWLEFVAEATSLSSPTRSGTLSAVDPRTQLRTTRRFEDALVIGVEFPEIDFMKLEPSKMKVIIMAPVAEDLPAEPAGDDVVAPNECARDSAIATTMSFDGQHLPSALRYKTANLRLDGLPQHAEVGDSVLTVGGLDAVRFRAIALAERATGPRPHRARIDRLPGNAAASRYELEDILITNVTQDSRDASVVTVTMRVGSLAFEM